MGQQQQQKQMKGTSNLRENLVLKLLEKLRFYPKEIGIEILEVHLVFSRRYLIILRTVDKVGLNLRIVRFLLDHSCKETSYLLGRLDLDIYHSNQVGHGSLVNQWKFHC